jgi:hypothetical protein
MGGWCDRRDKCQHYTSEAKIIVERLCEAKQHECYLQRVPSQNATSVGAVPELHQGTCSEHDRQGHTIALDRYQFGSKAKH